MNKEKSLLMKGEKVGENLLKVGENFVLEVGKEAIYSLEKAQDEKFKEIAQEIYKHRDKSKIVMISGPSSSGKTSSSLRIAQHCQALRLKPKVIELDNYFVDRTHTPRDAEGNLDFECLEAMDLELLNKQLQALLAGEKVEIPRFDFSTGFKVFEGNYIELQEDDILIMEGIHALNPKMAYSIDSENMMKIYISHLSSIQVEEGKILGSRDIRLLRRILRDNRSRGINPELSIIRWESVVKGEEKYIIPFQKEANIVLNSAVNYELAILKSYISALLDEIAPESEAYAKAQSLLEILDLVPPCKKEIIDIVPLNSILREFIGGQNLSL